MKVALIGATGFVGAPLLTEFLSRGHQVTVLARNPAKLSAQPGLTVVQADALDATQVAQTVAGQYRTGLDNPLPGEGEAPAAISVEDMAVTIVDELEQPRHIQQRFTVAN